MLQTLVGKPLKLFSDMTPDQQIEQLQKRIQQLEEANQILRTGLEQMRKANEALWEDLKRITK